jgi:organic radical activating enzyme
MTMVINDPRPAINVYFCSVLNDKFKLPVMEFFHTLQGEGRWTGHAAFFIRLAGCDVGCVWCDVKESWEVSEKQWMKVDDLVWEAAQYPSDIVVITGGEPAMYDMGLLTEKLHAIGKRIHLETSGAYPIRGKFDWVCLSPKKFKEPIDGVLHMARELKVVIFHPSDFDWADAFAEKVHDNCELFLQPEWSRRDKHVSTIIDKVKMDPRWRISLQTHKYLDIP